MVGSDVNKDAGLEGMPSCVGQELLCNVMGDRAKVSSLVSVLFHWAMWFS